MSAISHLPSGISHYTKKAIVCLITMTLDIVILCTARPLCTSSRRSFVVQGDTAWPGENTNECTELMSVQTHRERSGGLCCLLWFQSTSTTRPSKHSESFYSLTVLPPASTPPQGCCFLSLPPEWRWEWMRRHDCVSPTEEGSLLHGSLTLFSLANFSFRLASPPTHKHTARTRRHAFSSPAQPPSAAPRRFWWWLWHACCHASVLQEVENNRAVAIWGEISRQNPT